MAIELANNQTLTLVANGGSVSLRPIIGTGPTGATGATGPQGPTGATGAPGGSDASFAGWINDTASQTRAALSASYGPGGTAGNINRATAQGVSLVNTLIFGG